MSKKIFRCGYCKAKVKEGAKKCSKCREVFGKKTEEMEPSSKKSFLTQREYTLGELLSNSWNLFTNNFWLIVTIMLIVYLPLNIISSIFSFENINNLSEAVVPFIVLILMVFAGSIGTMAIAYIVDRKIEKQDVTFKEALHKSLFKWPVAAGTSVLMFIFLIGLSFLLLIPAIIFWLYWSFAIYAVVLRDKSWKSALDYSKSVVKGKWWKVFGTLLVLGIIYLPFIFVIQIPVHLIPKSFLVDVISSILTNILSSFFMVAWVVLFVNLEKY